MRATVGRSVGLDTSKPVSGVIRRPTRVTTTVGSGPVDTVVMLPFRHTRARSITIVSQFPMTVVAPPRLQS